MTALNSKPLDLCIVITRRASLPSGAETERSAPSVSHQRRKPMRSEPSAPIYSRTQSRKAFTKAEPPSSCPSGRERSRVSQIL